MCGNTFACPSPRWKVYFFFEIKGNIIFKNLKEEERKITRRVFERSAADLPCTPQVLFFSFFFSFLVYPLFLIFSFLFEKSLETVFLFLRWRKIIEFSFVIVLRLSYDVKVASLINQRKYEFLEPVTSTLHNYLLSTTTISFEIAFRKTSPSFQRANLYGIIHFEHTTVFFKIPIWTICLSPNSDM